MSTLDEVRLLRDLRAARPAAQRDLVHRFGPMVHALVDRMLRPRGFGAQVEDVAQETFVDVFKKIRGFDPKGSARLSTWILTIASRRAIDAIRRSTRRQGRQASAPGPVAAAGPDSTLLGRRLANLVGALPPDLHSVFVLRAFHEFTDAEIATALAIPIGTVKSRLSRARGRLKAALAEEGQ